MTDDTKRTLPKRLITVSLSWLQRFAQLWSRQTLADLPDRIKNLWQQLLGSYWFIPTTCVLAGILLAPLFIYIDQQFDRATIKDIRFAFTGDDASARSIMTTIAGAVLGVAGTTFSITIAVLSMASSQFGPRLLRNFLTDTSNQFVLGAFIGTFSYSLLVLKAIHKYDVGSGVPQLSVTFAIIMAVICALLLVYFIQHMVHAIQASHVIQGANNDALANIHYWYSDHCEIEHQRNVAHNSDIEQHHFWRMVPMHAPSSGYLQHIFFETLVNLAKDYGGVVRLHTKLGSFVTDKNIIGYFYQRPAEHKSYLQKTKTSYLAVMPRMPDGLFWQRLAKCLHFERQTAYSDDIASSLGQVTEIAVRALSPGTNDPKTAVNCVQSLTICLSHMMQRQPPSPYYFYTPPHDNDQSDITVNQPRIAILALITTTPQISDFIDMSLGEIRRYATADLMVLKALCQAITDLNYARVDASQRQILLHELALIERAGQENLGYEELVKDLQAMCEQARQFIHSDDAWHQHFEYMSEFNAQIHQRLQTPSSWL